MSVIKNWKTYYTFDEAIEISDKKILENAKKFANNVISKQKDNTNIKENLYV